MSSEYAIIESKGVQFKVSPGERIHHPKIDAKVGDVVELKPVILLNTGDKTVLGKPEVKGASVTAEVTAQGREDKVIVFKMKRRKRYRVKRGHRQDYTEMLIREIVSGKPAPKSPAKAAEAKKAETADERAKPAAKKTTAAAKKAKAATARKAAPAATEKASTAVKKPARSAKKKEVKQDGA